MIFAIVARGFIRSKRNLVHALGLTLAFSVIAPTDVAGAKSLGAAKKAARQQIRDWTFVPKVPLGMAGVYQVNPDGTPTDDQQGKVFWLKGTHIGANKRVHTPRTCMDEGKTYRRQGKGTMAGMAFLDFEVHSKEVQLALFTCVRFKIRYGRKVTAADLDPNAIAKALSGYFRIRGPGVTKPGDALKKLESALAANHSASGTAVPPATKSRANPFAPSSAGPQVATLQVEALPAAVTHGETVELILRFELAGPPGAIDLVETHTLLFDGHPLPNYPKSRATRRSAGRHESLIPQKIPGAASPGVYKFKAEVCIADDCRSRAVTFEVQ